MSHPFDDWLHKANQPMPSYHEMASWLFARQRSLDEAISSGSVAYIRAELSVITTGLMMFDAAKHRDLSNVEIIWRVDISHEKDWLAATLADIARALREHVIETESESRERFEAWCVSEVHSTIDMCRADDGAYCNPFVQEAWEAWQASQQWRAES